MYFVISVCSSSSGEGKRVNQTSFPFLFLARSSCLCTSCAELLSSLRSTSSRWSVFQFGSDVTRLALFLSSPRPRCSWLPSSARQRRMRPSESQTILYPLIFFTGDIVSSRLCQNSIAFLYEWRHQYNRNRYRHENRLHKTHTHARTQNVSFFFLGSKCPC